MIPGLELLACQDLVVPVEVMTHVVAVESSFNPFAIGVVGARLARQPRSLDEAVATAAQLERDGHDFSLGLAQVNRRNLAAQGLHSYELAFAVCPNLAAGARILADCHQRAHGDWGKAFSCYYSGNFQRGFQDGYVQKVYRSMAANAGGSGVAIASGAGRLESPPAGGSPPGAARRSSVPPPARRGAGADDGPFVPRVTGPDGRVRSPPAAPGAAAPHPIAPAQAQAVPAPAPADAAFVF